MPQLTGKVQQTSLRRLQLQLLVAGVALLAGLAFFIFQWMSVYIVSGLDKEADVTAELVAARVASMVDYYGMSAGLLAGDPDIVDLLVVNDAAVLRAREESLRHVFPSVLDVKLLPPGLVQVDMAASPPLSYAMLAQMRLAENSDQAPPAEVHQFNTPQQHVNIVRRVMDPEGSHVVGHLVLSLPNKMLQGMLDDLQQLNGYIELRQDGVKGAPVVVVRHGDAAVREGEPKRVVPIAGSRWHVAYWPAVGNIAYLTGISVWVLGAFAVAAAGMALLVFVLVRKVGKAVRVDEVSMVTLMKDVRDGRVQQEYQGGLAELRNTLDFMTQLAQGTQSGSKPAAAPEVGAVDVEKLGQAAGDKPAADLQPSAAGAVGNEYETGGAANFSAAVQADNLILEDDPLDISSGPDMNGIDTSIFRAYDIRGVVNKTLTTDTVRLIGRAIGSEALQRGRDTIVVGRDGRLSGPELSEALIEGIIATGCNVKDIGCVPTPVVYFATYSLDTQSGVVVTGSHNPPDYNGLKIVIDGETLSGESIQDLRERIEAANFISGQGSVETVDVLPDYIERIHGDVSLARPLKVVVDCGNGVAGGVAPELFRGLGCEVTELFCEVDGNFPNHHPDPSKAENLEDLINAVRDGAADIGLAFDGDGDRLGVVTSAGTIIWPDRVLMLYARDILERNPGGQIIYDVKCTRFLDAIIREHGGKPLMWKTGHSFIKAKIKESGALLAGEMSGHIFIKERWYGFDDGLYAGARLLEILAKDPRASVDVFADLPDSVNTPELNVAMQEGEPQAFIERLLENAHIEGASISTIDGLRADFEDGWGLVRASNTTPVLVLRFEADNDAALQRIMDEFRRVMLQVNADLSLPF
jgi:phosphomannomutase/phosphoglucomutase